MALALQHRDTPPTASVTPGVSHPVPVPPLPAGPFAADRPQPSPTPQQRAAFPPDRTSGREGCAALVFSPDPQMIQIIAARLHWSESHSNTGPAQARGAAHVDEASGRWPASSAPSARHLYFVRCT